MTSAALKKRYEDQTGRMWSEDEGLLWLLKNRESFELDMYEKVPVLSLISHLTLSEKAGWLSQHHCRICNPPFPISIVPVRIEPQSWQAISSIDKQAFKRAMAHRLNRDGWTTAESGPVCVSFLFVCGARRRTRDLDNMAKLMMDSLIGVAFDDDSEVDHLDVMRLRHEGLEEYVSLRVSGARLNSHDTVVRPSIEALVGRRSNN